MVQIRDRRLIIIEISHYLSPIGNVPNADGLIARSSYRVFVVTINAIYEVRVTTVNQQGNMINESGVKSESVAGRTKLVSHNRFSKTHINFLASSNLVGCLMRVQTAAVLSRHPVTKMSPFRRKQLRPPLNRGKDEKTALVTLTLYIYIYFTEYLILVESL